MYECVSVYGVYGVWMCLGSRRQSLVAVSLRGSKASPATERGASDSRERQRREQPSRKDVVIHRATQKPSRNKRLTKCSNIFIIMQNKVHGVIRSANGFLTGDGHGSGALHGLDESRTALDCLGWPAEPDAQ